MSTTINYKFCQILKTSMQVNKRNNKFYTYFVIYNWKEALFAKKKKDKNLKIKKTINKIY